MRSALSLLLVPCALGAILPPAKKNVFTYTKSFRKLHDKGQTYLVPEWPQASSSDWDAWYEKMVADDPNVYGNQLGREKVFNISVGTYDADVEENPTYIYGSLYWPGMACEDVMMWHNADQYFANKPRLDKADVLKIRAEDFLSDAYMEGLLHGCPIRPHHWNNMAKREETLVSPWFWNQINWSVPRQDVCGNPPTNPKCDGVNLVGDPEYIEFRADHAVVADESVADKPASEEVAAPVAKRIIEDPTEWKTAVKFDPPYSQMEKRTRAIVTTNCIWAMGVQKNGWIRGRQDCSDMCWLRAHSCRHIYNWVYDEDGTATSAQLPTFAQQWRCLLNLRHGCAVSNADDLWFWSICSWMGSCNGRPGKILADLERMAQDLPVDTHLDSAEEVEAYHREFMALSEETRQQWSRQIRMATLNYTRLQSAHLRSKYDAHTYQQIEEAYASRKLPARQAEPAYVADLSFEDI